MRKNWIFLVLAAVFLFLGILFFPKEDSPKPVQVSPPVSVKPTPEPKPASPKSTPTIVLISDTHWRALLPVGSDWLDTKLRLKYPGSYMFEGEPGTYLAKVGKPFKQTQSRSLAVDAEVGDDLPVLIKNTSDHDLSIEVYFHQRNH